jgi:hypothetical protein
MSTAQRAGILWMLAAALAAAALGWQVLYELGIRECHRDSADLLVLCAGPLDGWVLPMTLTAALILLAIGIWRLVPPPRS